MSNTSMNTEYGFHRDGSGNLQNLRSYLNGIAPADTLVFGTVAEMKAAVIEDGALVQTKGYYDDGDSGGALYRIVSGNSGDGLIDHNVGGNTAVLQHSGTILVDQAGARVNTDDDSFSDALQALIDYSGSPATIGNPTTLKISSSSNVFIAKKAVWIANKDGIQFDFPGVYNCQIKIGTGFTITQPADFPDDGYNFAVPAFIMIARRREVGRGDPWIIPGDSGAGSPWRYTFKGFYFDASEYLGGARLDLIYAPELAHSVFEEITTFKARRFLTTIDTLGAYANRFNSIRFTYGQEAYQMNRGTTNHFNRCSIVQSQFGWTVKTNYSTYTCCSVDHWGLGNYSWDIGGQGATLNGCGCEYGYGGVFRATQQNSHIVVNGGFFLGGTERNSSNNNGQTTEADFGVTNMILVSNGANVMFNQTMLRTIAQPTGTLDNYRFPAIIRDGGKVSYSGNAEEGSFTYLQRYEWEVGADASNGRKSKVDFLDNKPAFKTVSGSLLDITGAGNNIDIPILDANTVYDDGYTYFDSVGSGLVESSGDVTEYRVPAAGVYRIGINARFENIHPSDYVFIQAGSQTANIYFVSDSDNIASVSYTEPFALEAGDIVKVRYRKYTEDATMRAGAVFFGEMF